MMSTPHLDDLPPESGVWLEIDIPSQALVLRWGAKVLSRHTVSTGLAGTGQRQGSGQTPLGWHYVRAAIGGDRPLGTVFRGRRPTGEIFTPAMSVSQPDRDWILSRILWLCGLETGHNRGGKVDSQRRFIYLHGTPPDQPMGEALSHGCIRLRDDDLLEVFARAVAGTPVWIHD